MGSDVGAAVSRATAESSLRFHFGGVAMSEWSDRGWTSWGGRWNASDWQDGRWSSSWDDRDWGQTSTAVVPRSCQTAAAEFLPLVADTIEPKPVTPGREEGAVAAMAPPAVDSRGSSGPPTQPEPEGGDTTPNTAEAATALMVMEPPLRGHATSNNAQPPRGLMRTLPAWITKIAASGHGT